MGDLISLVFELFQASALLRALLGGDRVAHQLLECLRSNPEVFDILFQKPEELLVLGKKGVEDRIQSHDSPDLIWVGAGVMGSLVLEERRR